MKSSMRTRTPSVLTPAASVTETVVGGTCTGIEPSGLGRVAVLGIRNAFCNLFGSEILDASPFKSPVAEWHEPHFDLNTASPDFALPTTTVGGMFREAS